MLFCFFFPKWLFLDERLKAITIVNIKETTNDRIMNGNFACFVTLVSFINKIKKKI